jgi:prepilin-type processing-associated H-X9-DG protein
MPDAQRRAKGERPDRYDRGNVAFADGHVDFVSRWFTWNPEHYVPWSPQGWRDPLWSDLPR